MGVNNEKEPLSRTTLERWLFDRSLNLKLDLGFTTRDCSNFLTLDFNYLI
jgi:hypothetical protein